MSFCDGESFVRRQVGTDDDGGELDTSGEDRARKSYDHAWSGEVGTFGE